MQGDCMKDSPNIYFEERKRASEFNPVLSSRESASELLDMSVSNLSSIELGKHKSVPPDIVKRMADVYNAPRLINYYCVHECPLKEYRSEILSCEVVPMERIAVKVVKQLRPNEVERYMNYMIDIAQDGDITEDELKSCEEIEDYFDQLFKTYSEFKIRISMARNEKAA